jgi:hypothetical protein
VTPNWVYKMIEGKGAFINRPTRTGGKLYDKFFVYIPADVARDGLFPFKVKEELKIRIDGKNKRLILEKSR